MTNYEVDVTYNSVQLYPVSIVPMKAPSTIKQKLGRAIVSINILGRDSQDWMLTITGKVTGASSSALATNRAAVEAFDDGDVHAYVDGIHNGNYIVEPGSLQFTDEGDSHFSVYTYTMRLIQKQ